MKLRQVASALLSLALVFSAVTVAGTKKLQAAGEHSITVNAISATYAHYTIEGVTDRHGPIDMAGGTFELSKYSAEEGEKIEVSANPKAGYAIDFILVGNGAAGTDISAQESLDFTMPDEDVIIDVMFRAVEGADPEYGAFFTTTEAYGTMDAKICADAEEANGFLLPEPTFDCPDDKMFVGWVNTDDGELYAPGANVPIPQGGFCLSRTIKTSTYRPSSLPESMVQARWNPRFLHRDPRRPPGNSRNADSTGKTDIASTTGILWEPHITRAIR